MQTFKLIFSLVLSILFFSPNAFALKIGVVDLNRALNESEVGIRAKHSLESKGRQKQQEIKLEEEELKKLVGEMRNNPLLSPDIKRQKETDLRKRQRTLQGKVRQFEKALRQEERKMTEGIFKELKSVIRTVSLREKYDLVLEKNASELILYMKQNKNDFTQLVIDHYNALKSQKQ